MPTDFTFATPVALPAQSSVNYVYSSLNLADAYAIPLPPDASRDPDLLARFIFSNQPAWIDKLLNARDMIVARFGLKTAKHRASMVSDAKADRIGVFKVYSRSDTEIVVGEDDTHLNFRVSILCRGGTRPEGGRELIVSTVVHCHNLLGRVYIFVIAPFHRMVVKASLRRAALIGWPTIAQ